MDLSTEERVALIEEWKRRKEGWKVRDMQGLGCLIMLAGVGVFLFWPKLATALRLDLPGWARTASLLAAIGLVVTGFFARSVRTMKEMPMDIVERAIAALNMPQLDAETRRRETVALLFHAWDHHGMRSDQVYHPPAIQPRIGPALDYVLAAERVLRNEKLTLEVFLPL